MSKRKYVMKKFLVFSLSTLLSSTVYIMKKTVDLSERMASVPFDIRNELYYDGILDSDRYLEYYGRELETGEIINKAVNTNKLVDRFVTYEELEKLEEADIHMDITRDMTFLEKCPNLKVLNIFNSELLTEEDIEYINNSNLERVVLMFNSYNVRKMKDDKFDISRIKKEVKINNSFYNYIDDLDQLTFYNYFINSNDDMFIDKGNLESMKQMDNYLNDVIDEYHIMETDDEREKIFLIADYVCNTIDYDKDVSESIRKYTEDLENQENRSYEPTSKSEEYNYHSISSIINQSSEKKAGICINYASLFDILCYKTGVKSRLVEGLDTSVRIGHAWNLVYVDDQKEFIDLTFYDSPYKEELLKSYQQYKDNETYTMLNTSLFLDTEQNYTDFNYISLDRLDEEVKKSHTYVVNNTLDGLTMINQDLSLKNTLLVSLTGGISLTLLEEIINKRKKKKKKRKTR